MENGLLALIVVAAIAVIVSTVFARVGASGPKGHDDSVRML
jgi:hypothetical protein